jgi:beta-glucosidase
MSGNNPFLRETAGEETASEMMPAIMRYMPLRAIVNFSMGSITDDMLNEIIDKLNKVVKG